MSELRRNLYACLFAVVLIVVSMQLGGCAPAVPPPTETPTPVIVPTQAADVDNLAAVKRFMGACAYQDITAMVPYFRQEGVQVTLPDGEEIVFGVDKLHQMATILSAMCASLKPEAMQFQVMEQPTTSYVFLTEAESAASLVFGMRSGIIISLDMILGDPTPEPQM